MRQRKRFNHKLEELNTTPGPLVRKTLINKSKSNDFDEAKTEWELIEHISSESHAFVENCQLCNHKNHLENWLIKNINTNHTLKIGSDCIRRFIQFAGTSNQADSNRFFQIKSTEILLESELQTLFKEVIQTRLPLARTANKFKRKLKDYLDAKGKYNLVHSSDGRKEIIDKILCISTVKPKDYSTLLDLVDGTLPVTRETKKFKNYQYKEGSTLNRKRNTVTYSTLNTSEAFKNPDSKYN